MTTFFITGRFYSLNTDLGANPSPVTHYNALSSNSSLITIPKKSIIMCVDFREVKGCLIFKIQFEDKILYFSFFMPLVVSGVDLFSFSEAQRLAMGLDGAQVYFSPII